MEDTIIVLEKDALRYVRKKKRKRRVAIISAISSILLAVFIIIALNLFYADKFTITTNHDPELSLTIDEEKSRFTTSLTAPPLLKAADIQYTDIPANIEDGLGSKNTDYYFAYSFYLKGISEEGHNINYSMSMKMRKFTNNLEEAIRIMVIKDSVRTVYAKAMADGTPRPIYSGETREEPDQIIGTTVPFKNNSHIIHEPYLIAAGAFSKFTIVMWIDGWESVNSMKGGVIQTDLSFSTISINETR